MNELSKQMQRDIVLVNELLSTNTEMGCVEFKHNNESPVLLVTPNKLEILRWIKPEYLMDSLITFRM